jgi:glycosyltransferase involved in cell wall biosynthesis
MKSSLNLLLATDAWRPQVNGVVRTWETSIQHLRDRGHRVEVIEPNQFLSAPVPFYPEIRLCLPWQNQLLERVKSFQPDAVHIATEGPIGLTMRTFLMRRRWHFTTSYHTKFPEYLEEMVHLPASWSYRYMRWFHSASSAILVATPTLEKELIGWRFNAPIRRWSRGVDLSLFYPRPKTPTDAPRPHLLYVGRVSKEKSIEDFLKVKAPGTKFIVGDGPIRAKLEQQYPEARFLGYRKGQALAEVYANCDLFVFPSRTDTFGLVLIEALASGLPVAAYPVLGPIDIINDPKAGVLNDNLEVAVQQALQQCDSESAVRLGRQYTWERCTDQLLGSLVDLRTGRPWSVANR